MAAPLTIFAMGAEELLRKHSKSSAVRILVACLLTACASSVAVAAPCDANTPYLATPATVLRAWHGFLHAPTRLAIDADDNVYVADPLRGRIVVRAADGRVLEELQDFDYPVSIAVDAQGRLYVGEGHSGRVDVFGPDRQRIGVLGQGDGEFGLPAHIAVHDSGTESRVFVSDAYADEVLGYDGDNGARLITIGGTGSGAGQFIFPSGVASAGGELYVVDRGNSRVQVFNVNGDFLRSISPPADNCGFLCMFNGASRGRARDAGIHVTADGTIYLAEASKGSVMAIAPNGSLLGSIGEYGAAPGQLRLASDVVVDSCGRVLVASTANGRVELFGLPGHEDHEAFAPARLTPVNAQVNPGTDDVLVVRLELPGQRLQDVTGITANDFASPLDASIGDADRNNQPELTLTFGSDLLQALGPPPLATLNVTGNIGALMFQASAEISVLIADSDGDGVDDPVDTCPATAPNAAVDASGCSLQQYCPCDAMPSAQAWRNHGEYVSCVTRTARTFANAGLLPDKQRGTVTREAARSQCGAPATAKANPRGKTQGKTR